MATNNNNPGGITYTGSSKQIAAGMTQGTARPEGGYYAKFSNMQDGLNYQAKLISDSKVTPPANTPGQTPTIQQKIQSVQDIKTLT